MTFLWKGVAVLGLAIAGLGATAIPAQARDHHYRDGWRGDRDHRWNDRRHWRDNRSDWRGHRQRCWIEWRRSPYTGRRVRVRICR
ncbi:hypothetical protein FHS51_001611 [Sphingobium wenxiniae]|uniref:Uncharacterized protein n=2 Tax=Sphingobium TaxID=165695 RepID=T0HT97_9SPHN|nr:MULTISPECIES: hypothetical protein [Sphingobium]EQB02545.1 hypothetical protein L485_08525 [Sphingobium baderi LL03]KMS60925.1 hypothetical protein V475_16935 [Sphingobium baderi LL03]MBB6191384.1 hypothetical protein [Sphingobium wenxiniae]TWH93321.1 hypothetical protein IQ35_02228 [Sphingobium wenxiniae]WRD76142.1 hypothetical protein QQ987_15425 [Sphingobium baderi]